MLFTLLVCLPYFHSLSLFFVQVHPAVGDHAGNRICTVLMPIYIYFVYLCQQMGGRFKTPKRKNTRKKRKPTQSTPERPHFSTSKYLYSRTGSVTAFGLPPVSFSVALRDGHQRCACKYCEEDKITCVFSPEFVFVRARE